jgi:hypothetical protein
MRLYILSNDPVTNVTYQLGASGTSVAVSVEEIDSISTIEIPDDVILASSTDSYIYVNVDNVSVPVCYSAGVWLDEVDVIEYTTNNNYIAFVNPKAGKVVKYKDLYKIMQRFANGTINRIHDILGY